MNAATEGFICFCRRFLPCPASQLINNKPLSNDDTCSPSAKCVVGIQNVNPLTDALLLYKKELKQDPAPGSTIPPALQQRRSRQMVVSLSQGKLGLRLGCPALIAYIRDGWSHCKCHFLYSLWLIAASSAGSGGAWQVCCWQPHHSQGCSGWCLSAPSSDLPGIWEGQGGIYLLLCFCGAGLGSRHCGSTQMWDVPPHRQIGFQSPNSHCSSRSSPLQTLQLHFTHCCPFLLRSAARGAAGGAQPRGSESISTTSFPVREQGREEGLPGVIPRCPGYFSQSFNIPMQPLWRKEQVSFGWCSAEIPCYFQPWELSLDLNPVARINST